MHRPSWFRDNQVLVVNASTCGINKDGVEQYTIDRFTGQRGTEIDNQLASLTDAVLKGQFDDPKVSYVPSSDILARHILVPSYYDMTTVRAVEGFLEEHGDIFEGKSLGELLEQDAISIRYGHGSPSADQRVGDVPYIKVSDLRAGQVNINPTNLIPRKLAEKFWRGADSGLRPFDLVSPERASKNIGEFCVLMPGQEQVVFTKEMIIIRAKQPGIDQFYLMWALSLAVVRRQWERVVFMQTNREDVGKRFHEVIVPWPRSVEVAETYGGPFKRYFEALDIAKRSLREELNDLGHDFHVYFA